MRRPVFTLFILLFSLNHAAQSMLPVEIPSPNASDLGRYGDVPVSYYSGRPEITIPLYEFDVCGVKLPISISYDAGGLLMNSLPGWTGHSWTLMAGGSITRISQGGFVDEYISPLSGFTNYFKKHDVLKNAVESGSYSSLLQNLMPPKYDLAPDVFYFNACGLSGRFFLGSDGEWKVASDKNIDVIFDIEDENNYSKRHK